MNTRLAALAALTALAVPTARSQSPVALPHIVAEARMAQVFESNIDHDPEATPSVGLVPALHLRVQNRPDKASLTLDYVLARHAYSNTDRWDRTSHQVRAAALWEVADDLETTTEAEVSIRGSSDDRDIANQVQLRQSAEWAYSRAVRAEVYATLRYKVTPDVPDERSFRPHIGLTLQHRWPGGSRLDIGGRAETNVEADPEGRYRRWTADAELRLPTGRSGARVEAEARFRVRRYPSRFAEDARGDETDALREDRQWTVGVTWHRPLLPRLGAEVGVEVDRRTSNDAGKHYVAGAARVGVVYRL